MHEINLFRMAYVEHDGPFERVIGRIERGFSVLVYLPGNCIFPAAEYLKTRIQRTSNWLEMGKCEDPDRVNVQQIWEKSDQLLRLIDQNRSQSLGISDEENIPPHAIFHNLPLTKGEISPGEMTFQFALLEAVRSGVVLGLADRDAGSLPESMARAFNEAVWLDEIKPKNFRSLIDMGAHDERITSLADLGLNDQLKELLTMRLRWLDPLRIDGLLNELASNLQGVSLNDRAQTIHKQLTDRNRPVDFMAPKDLAVSVDPTKSFDPRVVTFLKERIVSPYSAWIRAQTSGGNVERRAEMLPPGLILHGPPGTGKTTLAQWVAKEIGLPFRCVDSTEIKTSAYGEAEQNMRRIFREARRASPCVLVLDDADDLFPKRSEVQGAVASADRGIVSVALRELQGFHGSLKGVLVIMTTNRLNALDDAFRRRLELLLHVSYPNDQQITKIVEHFEEFYRFELRTDEKMGLEERFKGTVLEGIPTPEPERIKATKNHFSPAEIKVAMSLAYDPVKEEKEGTYQPVEIVKTIVEYYNDIPGD